MTRNLTRMLDLLELPTPVEVAIILVSVSLAKSGHSFWAIGGMVAFHALFVVATLGLAGFKEQCVVVESAPATKRPELSLVSTDPVKSSRQASSVLSCHPRPSATPQAPLREAA